MDLNHQPNLAARYRVIYNTLALLLRPLLLTFSIASARYGRGGVWGAWLADALAIAALLGFYWSLRYYDVRESFGTRQKTRMGLRISSLHPYVRHPLHFFGLVLIRHATWTVRDGSCVDDHVALDEGFTPGGETTRR